MNLRATTEHIKDILKKTLTGRYDDLKKEEEQARRKKQKKIEEDQKNKKITVEKFLAIMQALKNEKEIGKFRMD